MSEELWKDIERQVDDAPRTPQAHRDALAALETLTEYAKEGAGSDVEHDSVLRMNARLYRHLTASGVPGGVRRYVSTLRQRASHCGALSTDPGETNEYEARKYAIRSAVYYGIADEIEAALASAPAVCEWEYARTSLGRDGFKGACGADWWCEEGYGPAVISDEHPYCHGCGRRIQIAAAPQRGGEQ